MAKGGRVRIDLVSEDGDPFLTLRSPESGLVEFNDDGGPGLNSRLELHLSEGSYVVEATTWGDRSRVPAATEFELAIRVGGHDAYNLKVEQVIAPDRVVANQPFTVHYRVGNVGGGDLPGTHNAKVYLFAPRVRQVTDPLEAADGYWQASTSYHSGDPAAGPTSVAVDELAPFEVTLSRAGPSWVYVLVDVHAGREHLASQGVWRNLSVLSGPTFAPVTVTADGYSYRVSAEDTGGGEVEVSVESPGDPDAEIESARRAKAIYAAGVRTQVLEGLFERPAIAALRTRDAMSRDPAGEEAVIPASPTSSALITAFAQNHSRQIAASGLAERMAAGELVSRRGAEALVLAVAESAWDRYRAIESSWVKLRRRMDQGGILSFADALRLQAELAYAERILSPAIEAGDIVTAAGTAGDGWQDEEVEAMVADLSEQASCRGEDRALADALASARIAGIDDLLALEAELRAVLPVHGIAGDSALCQAAGADGANSVFLGGLTIAEDSPIPESEPAESTEPPPPTTLRIVARLGADGRIEHAVELTDGERILPERRFLPGDARPGRWSQSSDVELDGVAIGQIRTRRMADGRVELGFRPARGEPIEPVLRYLPGDAPTGVWLRSSEIEVPHPGSTLES